LPVLEAFDVAGDDAGWRMVDEVAEEVGALEVDLVSGRYPVAEADAEILPLDDRPSLMSALRDQRDFRAGEVEEGLEGVDVGVRPEQPHAAFARDVFDFLLQRRSLGADLREAGAEDDHVLDLGGDALLERGDHVAD